MNWHFKCIILCVCILNIDDTSYELFTKHNIIVGGEIRGQRSLKPLTLKEGRLAAHTPSFSRCLYFNFKSYMTKRSLRSSLKESQIPNFLEGGMPPDS